MGHTSSARLQQCCVRCPKHHIVATSAPAGGEGVIMGLGATCARASTCRRSFMWKPPICSRGQLQGCPGVSQEQHADGIKKVLHVVPQAGLQVRAQQGQASNLLCTGSSMQRGSSSGGHHLLPSLVF